MPPKKPFNPNQVVGDVPTVDMPDGTSPLTETSTTAQVTEAKATPSQIQEKTEEQEKLEAVAEATKLPIQRLATWKANFGKIFVTELNGQYFVLRALTGLDVKGIQADVQKEMMAAQAVGQLFDPDEQYRERFVRRGVLSPDMNSIDHQPSQLPGGTVSSLSVALHFHSNFLPPEQVLAQTIEI